MKNESIADNPFNRTDQAHKLDQVHSNLLKELNKLVTFNRDGSITPRVGTTNDDLRNAKATVQKITKIVQEIGNDTNALRKELTAHNRQRLRLRSKALKMEKRLGIKVYSSKPLLRSLMGL